MYHGGFASSMIVLTDGWTTLPHILFPSYAFEKNIVFWSHTLTDFLPLLTIIQTGVGKTGCTVVDMKAPIHRAGRPVPTAFYTNVGYVLAMEIVIMMNTR